MPGEDFIQASMLRISPGSKYFVMGQTTVNGAASSATQTFANTQSFAAGDKIYFETTGEERTILSVDSGTVVTLTATISTTNGETVNHNRYVDLATCGTIVLDGQDGRLYVQWDDITELEGRMWLIFSRSGDTTYQIWSADSSNFNDDVGSLLDPQGGARGATILHCFGGKMWAWYWTAYA